MSDSVQKLFLTYIFTNNFFPLSRPSSQILLTLVTPSLWPRLTRGSNHHDTT